MDIRELHFDGVINVDASDDVDGHSEYWRNPVVWDKYVVPNLTGHGGNSGDQANGGHGGSGFSGGMPCQNKISNGPWHGC
jgi:hypothetical protein